ncbi:hypothetical protein GF1_16510 [Desulfolithobacter dissulfuricans]|uniref:PIN domain-containing protein n=1 Tax=Desulfolithobacter dissulfuricans TaxID=2795293 RepID=A0A915UA90_9BACT|nr:PIN domain-containing protein [Desulfolithobacter dissulfuricans]BCO09275.1 hypothetical protein GF1_16510 [Desulfolithobacter dissulfuricans]
MKHYVLDTNVLLDNPGSINSFPDNVVVLPMQVIEELDRFKSNEDDLGRNARQVIRLLDTLRSKGSLNKGVELDNGGKLKIFVGRGRNPGLDMSSPDNRILSVAYTLHDKGKETVFVSGDTNVRVKAAAIGLEVMDRLPVYSVSKEPVQPTSTLEFCSQEDIGDKVVCGSCGAEIDIDDEICRFCGAEVEDDYLMVNDNKWLTGNPDEKWGKYPNVAKLVAFSIIVVFFLSSSIFDGGGVILFLMYLIFVALPFLHFTGVKLNHYKSGDTSYDNNDSIESDSSSSDSFTSDSDNIILGVYD